MIAYDRGRNLRLYHRISLMIYGNTDINADEQNYAENYALFQP